MPWRALLIVVPILAVAAPPASAGVPAVVTADFGAPLTPRPSMTGVLHSLSHTEPPDERIAPLRLGLVRGLPWSAPYARGVSFGARYTVVLSDGWGMPGSAKPWGGNGPPYADLDRWRRYVEAAAQRSRGARIVWDVWNEPNHPYFFDGTREQYFETYRVAERELRRVLGADAFVIGPSTAGYHPDWFTGLTAWCHTRGCRVDGLSWHELPGPPGAGIPPIDRHLIDTRRRHIDDPDIDVGVRELHVNEALSEADQAYPGEQLGTLALLEAGGADAAARACWTVAGSSSCSDNTLDGLLTPRNPENPARSYQPRAVWWATRRYADGVGRRVRVTSSRSRIVGIASSRAPDDRTATVVLAHAERRGNARPASAAPPATDVRLRLNDVTALPHLRGARHVEVRVERIPATGDAALARPVSAGSRTLRIREGHVELTLRHVRLHEAWVVRLKRAR